MRSSVAKSICSYRITKTLLCSSSYIHRHISTKRPGYSSSIGLNQTLFSIAHFSTRCEKKRNIDVKLLKSIYTKEKNAASNPNAWNTRYNELLQYIQEHGNSLVSCDYQKNASLYYWVNKQRFYYKANKLSIERIEKLSEVNFVWDMNEAQWLERFKELCQYRIDHGNTLVPRNYPKYPFLGKWVNNQRSDYKRLMTQKNLEGTNAADKKVRSSGMTEERIRLLESQDFVWDPIEHAWTKKYKELLAWVAKNGHGAIYLTKKHESLGTWAVRQRNMYKKYIEGTKIGLPKKTVNERIDKLKEAGFVFEPKKPRMATQSTDGASKEFYFSRLWYK